MTAPSDRGEQAPRKPLYARENASDPVSGVPQRPGGVSEPHRGAQGFHGRAVLTVTVDAPDARHAIRWAGYLRQHLHNEYGDQMRLQTAIEADDPDCGCHTVGAEHPGARCCVCGGGPVVYRNFAEQPFCEDCVDCSCGEQPCVRTGVNDPAVSEETRIAHLEAELVQVRSAVDRVTALAADMRTWCSPHDIAIEYADRIDEAIKGPEARP